MDMTNFKRRDLPEAEDTSERLEKMEAALRAAPKPVFSTLEELVDTPLPMPTFDGWRKADPDDRHSERKRRRAGLRMSRDIQAMERLRQQKGLDTPSKKR